MRVIRFLLPAIILLFCLTAISEAASWNSTRSAIVALKARGQAMNAYSLAVSQSVSGEDRFDRDFVAGWIALRSLGKPDLAIKHFTEMAAATAFLRGWKKDAGKAKAGYWLGKALSQAGRAKEAQTMFNASAAYVTTFYGQLSASELGRPLTRDIVSRHAEDYPVKSVYWHDSRVRLELLHAVIREESRFNQNAKSNKAAIGMMQVLDGTAKDVGKNAGVNIDTHMMRANADYNIAVGSRYLGEQLEKYNGNPMLAAAAYNAGPARADEWLQQFGDPRGGRVDPVDWAESVPFKETRDYIQKVVSAYLVYLAMGVSG